MSRSHVEPAQERQEPITREWVPTPREPQLPFTTLMVGSGPPKPEPGICLPEKLPTEENPGALLDLPLHVAMGPNGTVSEAVLIAGIAYCMSDLSAWPRERKVKASFFLMDAFAYLRDRGRLASYAVEAPPDVQVAMVGHTFGIPGNGGAPVTLNFLHSNVPAGAFFFQCSDEESAAALTPRAFAACRGYLEKLLGEVEIMTAIEAGIPATHGVLIRRTAARMPMLAALPEVIHLVGSVDGTIVFGTDVFTGGEVSRPVAAIQHMLVVGTPGFGKSVFLHQIVSQFCGHPEVERVYLVDLKGGVEFMPYADKGTTQVVSTHEGVIGVVGELLALLETRQREMVARRKRSWRQGRVFLVIDEFAQVQLWPVLTREAKEQKIRLLGDLTKLSMLGRAVGITLIAAIQKATTDVMDSSFRTNLQGQVCFRVANRLMAASMFGETADLRLDPIALRRGQFIFHDPAAGETRYLQAHVSPHACD